MANYALTSEAVMNKVQDITLHAIVSEAFINGLPIPAEEITDDMAKNLSLYAKECMDDLGGFHMLEKAIETATEPSRVAFLKVLESVCMETARDVTKRVLDTIDIEDQDLTEISDKVAMTPSEYAKFVQRSSRVNADEISKIIQKKTLDTIKEEKEAHKKDAELREELENAINDEDNGLKETTESVIREVLKGNERMSHQSFFGKLQEVVYESLMFAKESYTDLPYGIMTAVTKENTFPQFKSHNKSPIQAFESICRFKGFESTGVDAPDPQMMNDTLLTTAVIYTFFETLMTMNLWNPKVAEIQNFVHETLPLEKRIDIDKNTFMNALTSIVNDARKAISVATTPAEVAAVKSDLEIVREKCNESAQMSDVRMDVLNKIYPVIEAADRKIETLSQDPPKKAIESAFEAVARSRDVAQFDRINMILARKPNVNKIRFKVDPDSRLSSLVAVEGLDAGGNIVATSSIALESATGDLGKYVTSAIQNSRLAEVGKSVDIYMMNRRKIIDVL